MPITHLESPNTLRLIQANVKLCFTYAYILCMIISQLTPSMSLWLHLSDKEMNSNSIDFKFYGKETNSTIQHLSI